MAGASGSVCAVTTVAVSMANLQPTLNWKTAPRTTHASSNEFGVDAALPEGTRPALQV
jgi:hypothetical protein